MTDPRYVRVSNFTTEFITRAPQEVFPAAITAAPFYLRPVNWKSSVQLETAYHSDVARAPLSGAQDRRSLNPRPTRTLKCELLGTDAGRSFATLLGLLNRSSVPGPVPIYCDETFLTVAMYGVGVDRVLECPTRYRRFFRGQRIAILSPEWINDPNLFGGYIFATIRQVLPDRLLVTVANSGQANFPADSIVYPTFDADVSLTQDASLVTDSVLRVSLEATERSGGSTLPGAWRGPLSPVLAHVNEAPGQKRWDSASIPLFDRPHDWAASVEIELFREGSQINLGKGSMPQPTHSKTGFRYGLRMGALSRKDFWDILRFFDWAKGRSKSFWMPHFKTPWKVLEVATSYVRIQSPGTLGELNAFYRYVLVDLEDPATPGVFPFRQVREIYEISQNAPGDYTISFIPGKELDFAVPLGVAYVVPVSRMTLAEDVINEKWKTSEVCEEVSFSVVDTIDEKDAPISGIASAQVSQASILEIPDLTFAFDANVNVFSKERSAQLSSRLVRSTPNDNLAPSIQASAQVWFDAREKVKDDLVVSDLDKISLNRLESNTLLFGTQPRKLGRPMRDERNKGSDILICPKFDYVPQTTAQNGGKLTDAQRTLWDNNTGWTLIVCLSGADSTIVETPPENYPAYPTQVGISIRDGSRPQALFEWSWFRPVPNRAQQGRASFLYYDSNLGIYQFRDLLHHAPSYSKPVVMMLRWMPFGQGTQVYINGQGSAKGAINGSPWVLLPGVSLATLLMPQGGYLTTSWFQCLDLSLPIGSAPAFPSDTGAVDRLWNIRPGLNYVASHRRSLSNAELNQIGQEMKSKFGVDYFNI